MLLNLSLSTERLFKDGQLGQKMAVILYNMFFFGLISKCADTGSIIDALKTVFLESKVKSQHIN
ncbi:hypothetical protein DERF_006857 [Dermatophagoides farinae]|uniref:Uncharacterized protein n=1 Tax=Dermatophagoides farinae TaxID=6954 RepID=A0A922I289_DERFA|nr:hypothetical protein DERF_006857 [Dermatophagoides farinae]